MVSQDLDHLCKKCKHILVTGKGTNRFEEWCPNCEGMEIISKKDAIKELNDSYELCLNEIHKIFNKYNKDSIIGTLLSTREGDLHKQHQQRLFIASKFISLSLLIKDAVSYNNFGDDDVEPLSNDFQKIIHYHENNFMNPRFAQHIEHGNCIMVKIPLELRKNFTLDYEKNIEYGLVSDEDYNEKQIKFTKHWQNIMTNLESFGLMSEIKAEEVSRDMIKSSEIDEFKQNINLLLQFDLDCYDRNFINFPEFVDKFEFIEFLDVLGNDALHNFKFDMKKDKFECNLKKYDSADLFKRLFFEKINFKDFFDLSTFTESELKSFPLIYLSLCSREFFIAPYSTLLIKKYLEVKYVLEIGLENSKLGSHFEKEIAKLLNLKGLKTLQPNSCNKELINIKDDPSNPNLEIDIIAYNQDTIWVIDCKHLIPDIALLDNQRRSRIIRKLSSLKMEEKQKNRILFVKEHLSRFGFSTKKIKNYKSAIITLLEEPLKNLGGTYLISKDNIEDIKKIPNVN